MSELQNESIKKADAEIDKFLKEKEQKKLDDAGASEDSLADEPVGKMSWPKNETDAQRNVKNE